MATTATATTRGPVGSGAPAAEVDRPVTVRAVLAGFRPWHPLLQRSDRFHWLLGARVAVAFIGPVAVSHLTGRWEGPSHVFALGAFLVTLFVSSFDGWRRQLVAGLGLSLALPVAVAATLAHGPARVLLLVATGLVAGRGVGWGRTAAVFASSFGIAVLIAPELPATAAAAGWVWLGGLFAVALTLATAPLAPDHLRPKPRAAAVDHRLASHHSVRLAVALGAAGVVAEVAGDGSPIRAHALWMGIGVWIVLQPHLHDTLAKGVQRALGTVGGGLLTLLLVQALPGWLWPGWVFLGLTFVCFGLRSVNYGWYCVALTPVIVLGFGPVTHDYAVLEARLGWTVVGSLLALAVRFALWPTAGHVLAVAPAVAEPVAPDA